MISPSKLAHVVWRTAQIEEMVSWYTAVLGARVVFQSPEIAFVTYDDEHHRMAFISQPDGEPQLPDRTGLDHVAFTYESFDDLLAVYDELAQSSIEPYWTINHGPTTSLYYRDPDGNQIELQYDNYPDLEVLADWFRTGAFMRNPIGVEVDPRDLLRQRKSGVPAARLIHRTDTPADFIETHSRD